MAGSGNKWVNLRTESICRTSLTLSRARRFVHGHSSTKHTSSAPFDPESERSRAQTGLLLPFLDERRSVRSNGQGAGP